MEASVRKASERRQSRVKSSPRGSDSQGMRSDGGLGIETLNRKPGAAICESMAIQIRTSLAEPDTGESFVPHKPVRPDNVGSDFLEEVKTCDPIFVAPAARGTVGAPAKS